LLVVDRATADEAWSAPPLEKASVILDGRSHKPLSFEELTAVLAEADVVFLGEQHTDETTHRFQLQIFQRLLQLKQNRVVLALEMFDRDVQPALEKYLAGEISESEFLANARPWSNYAEAYRPLVLAAKERGSPVVASNFPAPIRRKLAMEGPEAMAKLAEQERQQIPRAYLTGSAAYWKRVDNAVRGHMGVVGAATDDEDRLYSTQSLWDNAMGEACADALDKHVDHVVVHVNGSFHSSHWEGAVHQLKQRKPDARIVTISIVPTVNPATYRHVAAPSADYLALIEAVATNIDEGKRSVYVGRELKYLFHLPDEATADAPAPMLIWLCEDGLTAQEGMELCRQKFGEAVAIAVVEPPYKERQFDLAVGGRWFWTESFSEDVGSLVGGIGDVWAYLLRHFPIDHGRVCIAGEGAGATVAAAAAVHTDRMNARVVAMAPKQYAKLKDLPLPLTEDFAPGKMPERQLTVVGPAELAEWWGSEVQAYRSVKVDAKWVADAADPSAAERRRFKLIRDDLGLAAEVKSPERPSRVIVVSDPTPRARHWARLQSNWLSHDGGAAVSMVERSDDGGDATVSLQIRPDAASKDGVLPKCPGPFGGTTVVVLSEETPDQMVAEWLALEKDDPLARESRFHRVRIATATGEMSLARVLAKLQSENRRNVLIVPAMFYAPPAWLHALNDLASPFDDAMTLQWLPGLGGRKGSIGP
jgi:uncharacterized iron-regulated protein